ncbi:MAG: glycosyltransferase family 39 protein [Anaerolineae bacterium]
MPTISTHRRHLLLSLLALLIAAAAISSHADDLALWPDEIFSVVHARGSLEQIIIDRDLNWPAGYFLLLHGWGNVASFHDFSLHWLGALLGLLTTALLIRTGRELLDPLAGWLIGVAFATSSYTLTFILELRGYTLMFLTIALFLLCYLRWLKHDSRWRRVWLVIAGAAMLYTHFILWFVLVATTAHLIVSKPRKLLTWLLLLIASFVIAAPLIPQFILSFQVRGMFGGTLPGYFFFPLETQFRAYSAQEDWLFGGIVLLTVIGIATALISRKLSWQTILWLGGWGVLIPILAYLLRERLTLWTTRYLTFTAIPVFILIGVGVASLRWQALRLIGAAGVIVLAAVPWKPYDHRPAETDGFPPLQEFMRYVATELQLGDEVIIDPRCSCQGSQITWSYYESLYLPMKKLPITTHPDYSVRRLWYITRQGSETPQLLNRIQNGRIQRSFWGPWYFAVTLWELPPDPEGLVFGDSGIRFMGADIDRQVEIYGGDTVSVMLWWQAAQPLADLYSFSLQLRDSQGRVIVQSDGVPTPLSSWIPEQLVLDQRTLTIPYGLASGRMTLHLLAYRWEDGVRLTPQGTSTDSILLDRLRYFTFNAGS